MSAAPGSHLSRRWRLAALGLGIALLLWLPFEDTHLAWIYFFALLISLLAVLRLTRIPGAQSPGRKSLTRLLAGLGGGLLVTPAALLLMAFKSGIHGHGFPDFTPEQVLTVLNSAPLWVLAGLLAGAGFALLNFRSS